MEKEEKKINIFEEETISGREIIDETTINSSEWINLPKKTEVGKSTPVIIVAKNGYFKQDGKHFENKATGKTFYSGLLNKFGNEVGEYIVEGNVNGVKTKIRISNWELVYKMFTLVRFLSESGKKLSEQEISFKRESSGAENAGHNWSILLPKLKIKIIGKNNEIQKLE